MTPKCLELLISFTASVRLEWEVRLLGRRPVQWLLLPVYDSVHEKVGWRPCRLCESGWRSDQHHRTVWTGLHPRLVLNAGNWSFWMDFSRSFYAHSWHSLISAQIQAVPTGVSLWMGAHDSITEGGWTWTDGSPFRYINWAAGDALRRDDKLFISFIQFQVKWRR